MIKYRLVYIPSGTSFIFETDRKPSLDRIAEAACINFKCDYNCPDCDWGRNHIRSEYLIEKI